MIKEIMKTAVVVVFLAFFINTFYGKGTAEIIPDLFSTLYKEEVSKVLNLDDSKHPNNIGNLE